MVRKILCRIRGHRWQLEPAAPGEHSSAVCGRCGTSNAQRRATGTGVNDRYLNPNDYNPLGSGLGPGAV